MFRNVVLLAISSLVTLPAIFVTPKPASANPALAYCQTISDPIRRFYCEGSLMSSQAQWDRWNTYSPRQRQFAYTISQLYSTYAQRSGQPIPLTQQNVIAVANYLGADQSELAFIYDRMLANHNAIVGVNQADTTINRYQNFLNCVQTQGTGCIP